MFLTGFADEAGRDLESQIRATLELKWNHIDIRLIGETFFGMLPENEFEDLCSRLSENRIAVNCYGSSIANGETLLFSQEHYERSRQDLMQAIPRMKKLGIPMLRGMSFRRAKGDPDTPEIRKYVFEKVNGLAPKSASLLTAPAPDTIFTLQSNSSTSSTAFSKVLFPKFCGSCMKSQISVWRAVPADNASLTGRQASTHHWAHPIRYCNTEI